MSAVLSPWFSVVLFLLCGSSEGLENITKKPGEDVTLPCRTENNHTLIVLEWTSEGLKNKTVFVFRDGRPYTDDIDESFKNRVSLSDSQMKDGDLSVVLKNVTMNDSGTYQCKVKHENDPQREVKLISSIHLWVVPPGQQGQQGGREDAGDKKGSSHHLGLIVLLVPVVVAVVVVLWFYSKNKGPNQSSSGSNIQQNPEQDRLNSDSNAERNTNAESSR